MRVNTARTTLPERGGGEFAFLSILGARRANGAPWDQAIKETIARVYGEDAEDAPEEWEVLDSETDELPDVENFKYISDENALGAGGMFYIVEDAQGRDKAFVVYNTFKPGETDLFDWLKGLRIQFIQTYGDELRESSVPQGFTLADDDTVAPHIMNFKSIESVEAGVFRYTTKAGNKVVLDVRSADGSQVIDPDLSDAKMTLFLHVRNAYNTRFSDIMPGNELKKLIDEHDAWVIDPGNGDESARIGDVTPEIAKTGVFHDVDYNGTIDLIMIENEHGSRAVIPGSSDEDDAYFSYVRRQVEQYGTDPSVLEYGSRYSDAYKNGDLDGYTFADGDTPVPGIFDIKTVQEIKYGDERQNYIKYATRDDKKIIVDKGRNPEHYNAALAALKTFRLRDDGYIVVDESTVIDSSDIKNVSPFDKYPDGLLTFERGGEKYAVHSEVNPNVYSAAMQVRSGVTEESARQERGDDFSFIDDLDVMSAETDTPIEEGGKNATVTEYIFKKLIEKYGGMKFRDNPKGDQLGKDDPRFKFLQAFQAITTSQQGMTITPFIEDVRWEGAHTSRSEGKKRDLTAADMEDFIDSDAAYQLYMESLQSDEVQADYQAFFEEALGEVDGVDEKREKLRDLIENPKEFLVYLQNLTKHDKKDVAEQELQKVVSAINSLLVGDEATDAVMKLTLGGTTEDLDSILENPDEINASIYHQTTSDLIAIMLRSESLTTGSVRRTLETLRALNDNSPEALASVLKEVQKLYLEFDDSVGDPKAESIRQAVERGLDGLDEAVDTDKFTTSFLDLNKHGLLGSFVGGIGIITGVMKLTNWKDREGSDGLIDGSDYSAMAAARDFINALSLNTSFVTSFDSGLKLLKQGGLVDMLGLSGSLPEVWGEDGVLKEYRDNGMAAQFNRAVGEELNRVFGTNPTDVVDEKAKGFATRALEGIGINGVAPKVATTAAGTVLRVLSSLADVALGVVDIILGVLNVRGNIEGMSPGLGGVMIFAGILEATAGVAGTFLMFGRGGNWAKAIMSGALSIALIMSLVTMVVSLVMEDQKSRYEAQLKYFQNLEKAGLLEEGWGEKLEYAMYTLYDGEGGYGSRDAPENISMFDHQWKEFEHFRETPGKQGSSQNRLDADLRFNADGSDWVPQNGNEANGDAIDFEATLNTIVSIYAREGIFSSDRKLWGFNQDGRPIKPLFAKLIEYYVRHRDADASPQEAADWAIDELKGRIGNAFGEDPSDDDETKIDIFMNYVNKDSRNGKKDALAVATEVIEGGSGQWFNPDDPLEGLSGVAREAMLQRYIKDGIRNSDGVLVYLDPNDYSRKINWDEEEERFEDAGSGEVLVWNEDERRYAAA